jgi:hypothetical protein
MKKLMLLTGIFAFILFSCEEHDWQWVVTREATQSQDGEEIETCSLHPGETRGKPRVIHYWGDWGSITATDEICSGEVKKCVNCGIEGEKRNILQHTWGTWVITTPATEEADGSRNHTCQRQSCLRKVTEIIPQLTRQFYAQSFKDGSFYTLTAKLLVNGTYCKVYADTASSVTKQTAESVNNQYENNVYTKMINTFGTNNSGFNFSNELIAINEAEGGKLIILLLDIRDNYQAGVNASAVGGYFLWTDLFLSEPNSNGRAMIYIDTSPGIPGGTESNKTLAHEMQHLINEIASQTLRFDGYTYNPMDLWIDEGLSTAAEWVYLNGHPTDRYGWYNNGQGLIKNGNNFYVWGNRSDESLYAEIDDYATAYLFFQWLRLQNNGVGIYKDIIGSTYSDYRAVTSAASKFDSSYNNNWGGLLRDWLAANYINSTATTGANSRYGYKNDATLSTLNKHLLTSGTSVSLYPGEGVFSKIDTAYVTANPSKPVDKTYIKYSILTTAPGNNMAVGALLTYNVNTVNVVDGYFPSPEDGTVTGVASISVVDGRFVSPPVVLSGPFWVSGGDVLRRNGSVGIPPAGVTRPSIRVAR